MSNDLTWPATFVVKAVDGLHVGGIDMAVVTLAHVGDDKECPMPHVRLGFAGYDMVPMMEIGTSYELEVRQCATASDTTVLPEGIELLREGGCN